MRIPVSARSFLGCVVAFCLFAPSIFAQTSDLVSKTQFRVCADPANSPMSDKSGSGFENRIAELIASKLGLPVVYSWYPMSTGFVRNSLQANKCDVIIGYAQGHELVLNTNHYFTSIFVLIVPEVGKLQGVRDLSDPRLRGKRVGIIAGSPPASHMLRHDLIRTSKPYPLFVDRRYASPATDMLDDLRAGRIDAAILWGPIGGPLLKTDYPGFKLIPLMRESSSPRLFYRITMGVRRGERVWSRKLNSLLRRNRREIEVILREAGVPLMNDMGTDLLDSGL